MTRTCDSMQLVHVFLETERLVLRRFTEDDVDLLVELDSDPEVMRFKVARTPEGHIDVRYADFTPLAGTSQRRTGIHHPPSVS